MNLADMLCYADIAELTAIAETYECNCSSHSKNELIQSILAVVPRRDVLESRVSEMTDADLRFLNSLLFDSRNAYSLEELKARAVYRDPSLKATPVQTPPTAVPEPSTSRSRKAKAKDQAKPLAPDELARHAISRFKRFGWLFNGFSQHTRYLYHVPEDVRKRLSDALERRYRNMIATSEEPTAYRDERALMMDDVLTLLKFVRDHDLQITGEGVLYKRQLGQLLELMSVQEAVPSRGGWRFGYGRHFKDYPDRLSLLYDFAYYNKWMEERADRLFITETGRNVLDGEPRVDPSMLYQFWLRLYKGPVPNLTTLVQWVSRLGSEWVTVDSLYQIVQPLVRSYYYDTSRDVFERRVLTLLMHQGIIRWGETSEGVAVVQVTPQGRQLVSGQTLSTIDPITLDRV